MHLQALSYVVVGTLVASPTQFSELTKYNKYEYKQDLLEAHDGYRAFSCRRLCGFVH